MALEGARDSRYAWPRAACRHYGGRRMGNRRGGEHGHPGEFESALPIGSMVTPVLTKLLALAADKSGRIANDEPSEIFDKHILAAMEMEPRTMSLLRSVTTLGLQW